ncbi:chromate transporter, partial [Tetragenococcus halophilus]|nr:chromate transporter [Tetragenococcus halophilus]
IVGTSTFDLDNFNLNMMAIILFIASLFLLRKYKLNPILVMVLTGIVGLFVY